MTMIAACPFCGCTLEKSEVFSSRSTEHFMHPRADEGEECIASSIRILVSDREDDKHRLALWNRRTPPPQTNLRGDLADVIRLGIKDQGYGYTLKGDKLTVSSDEVFAIDIAKLADFIRAALATTEGKDNG